MQVEKMTHAKELNEASAKQQVISSLLICCLSYCTHTCCLSQWLHQYWSLLFGTSDR